MFSINTEKLIWLRKEIIIEILYFTYKRNYLILISLHKQTKNVNNHKIKFFRIIFF